MVRLESEFLTLLECVGWDRGYYYTRANERFNN